MPDRVVYRSTSRGVLAHCEVILHKQVERNKRIKTTLADLGFEGRRPLRHGISIIGVEYPGNDIPEGWRRDRDFPTAIVPARRTRLGKQIAAQLDKLRRPMLTDDMPGGMPDVAMSAGLTHFLRPSVHHSEEWVLVSWPDELDAQDASHIDPAVWERIKLSEYYALIEEDEARFKTKENA